MKKRVIIDLPKGQSGLQVKMRDLRAGLGLNANTMPWPIMAGKMSEPNIQVNSTLSPVPRDEANLEAEKGEVAALPTKSGIPDTYKIGGKRHYEGGTPLNLPKDSFIYSDTPKMRIKDKVVLAQFGMPERKSGYTPAEIAKKYDVAPFKKILVDKNTDKLQKETAELMIANYNLKLAKLALVQESMKGFPQGIPLVAMPYIESMQIDPAEFVQMNPGQGDAGAQQEEAGSTMAYGGDVDYFDDGGVPKLNRRKRNAVDNAVQSSYNKMLEGRATDQYDELFYDAGLSNDKVRKFMVNAAGPSGATNDPGTYARNINNLLGRAVIPFPVNQNRMTEENWNAIGIGSGPRIPDMYYNDDAPAGPYRNMNYETLTPIKPSISEFDPAYEFMAYGGMPRYADGGITPEQAKVMMEKALATNDPAVMKQTAANIAAMKDSGALSWAWNPLADEWDFDKYEDLLNDKAEQVANYNKGQENYTAYKNKFFGQVLPEYEKAYKQFQANPLAATNVDMKKMKDVMKLKNQLGAYELAIQADKQGKPPPVPVSGDMLMGNPSTVFNPALLDSYVPTKEVAPLKETKTENVSVNDAAAAEAAARLAKGQPAATTTTTTQTSKWDKYKIQ